MDLSFIDELQNKNILNRFEKHTGVNTSNTLTIKSSLMLYKEELLSGYLFSYIENLDRILKNVLIPQRIVEFTGHFSCTTPICLQLCLSIQLPKNQGGFESEAFYISTNGNFSIEKLREMALSFVGEYSKDEDNFNVETLLSHIYYTRVYDLDQLVACLFETELIIQQNNVRLLILDSITIPLRSLQSSEKFKTVSAVIRILRNLADKYNIIVVVTNFCTTRINETEAYTVASLGDSFYHMVNSRISFTKTETFFKAKLLKHVMYEEKEVIF
ncbi:DNA repair protein RAD51 homolog 3-like [Diabrotica undecimpunctata]|uniref:DNA repair protein RAD51 homolog 3-like n=1 Tax=Diabrotica undecimpunctata TaxID=50387 RepID=UPI003B63C6D0